jgi:hypothetical protein
MGPSILCPVQVAKKSTNGFFRILYDILKINFSVFLKVILHPFESNKPVENDETMKNAATKPIEILWNCGLLPAPNTRRIQRMVRANL